MAIRKAIKEYNMRKQRFKPVKERVVDVDALTKERNEIEAKMTTASDDMKRILQRRLKYLTDKIRCAWRPGT